MMDIHTVRYYLSEWGRLRRLNWSPGIGFKSIFGNVVCDDPARTVDDVVIERVFSAMKFVKSQEPAHYSVMRLTYEDQQVDTKISEGLCLSKRRIRDLRHEGENRVAWFLMGATV